MALYNYSHFVWNYWWMGYALENGLSPWYTDFVLYPHTHNLSLHTMTPLWFPAYAIFAPLFGEVATVNLFLWISFPLSGLAMWWWLRPYTRYAGLAFIGGLIFAFQPYTQVSASATHLNLVALWWLPLCAGLWRGVFRAETIRRRLSYAVALGLALWGCWLTDFQWPMFLAFPLSIYGLWTLWAGRARLVPLVMAGTLTVAIMFPLMWIWPLPPFLAVDTSNPFVFPPASAQSIRDWAIPLTALIGDRSDPARRLGLTVPYLLLFIPLALLIFRRSKPTNPAGVWLLAAIISGLLMLGGYHFTGDGRTRLPYWYLHDLLNGQYRTPERFVIPTLFSAVTFAVMVWSPLLKRHTIPARVALVVLIPILTVDLAFLRTFPTREVYDHPIYHQIGSDERDYVIVDLPLSTHYGWTGLGTYNGHRTQLHAVWHRKRVVNGFLARMPFPYLAYYLDSPLFTWLASGDQRPLEQMQTMRETFDFYVREWPIGYVFAHLRNMDRSATARIVGWMNANAGFCTPQISDDRLLIWWRNAALTCDETSPTTEIDIGGSADWLYIVAGWHYAEDFGGRSARWATQHATLRVDLPQDGLFDLTFTAVAFRDVRRVTIGGVTVEITPDDWHEYTLTVDADNLLDAERRILTISHDSADTPQLLGLSEDERELAVAYADMTIRPR